eukprot:10503404-Ditylum_brightwellii.AAC.1
MLVTTPTLTPQNINTASFTIPTAIINQFNAQKLHHSQQHQHCQQHQYQKTCNQDFQGCNLCKMDFEDMVNVACQLFNHKDDNCPLIDPQNIRIKNICKALTQHVAKHPPPDARPELDTKRKTAICPMLSRKPLAKKVHFELSIEDQDEEGYSTAQEDEPTLTDDIINEGLGLAEC